MKYSQGTIFDPEKLKDGSGYVVHVYEPSDLPPLQIGTFSTLVAAEEWIKQEKEKIRLARKDSRS